jgi:hypothetical protein
MCGTFPCRILPSSFRAGLSLLEVASDRSGTGLVLSRFVLRSFAVPIVRHLGDLEEADGDIPGMGGQELTDVALKELGDAFGTLVRGDDIK